MPLRPLYSFSFVCGLLILTMAVAAAEELRIPAFTAYIQPDADAARVSEQNGVTRWTDPRQSVNWYGKFEQTGALTAKVQLRLPSGKQTQLKLTVDNQSHPATVTGQDGNASLADFGTFQISSTGYHRFSLESLNAPGEAAGDIETLVLDGTAIAQAHFNFKERRNAASVHLMYPVPEQTNIAAFYCEVTAMADPTTTFYMACGWHRGYFGMQINSPTERRIIFSVWDSREEAVDRAKVNSENRVTLMSKGEGVYSGDFGNEGTGGHSHFKVMWKTGEAQRFIVTAKPTAESKTTFNGYWFHPEQQQWMLISSWQAPKEGGWLKRPHSFSENFGGANGNQLRKALYGNQWIRTSTGEWIELTAASFSHDPTGKSDRLDRFMGVENVAFFLSHGGFVGGFSKFGEQFHRPALMQPPQAIIVGGKSVFDSP